MKIFISWSGERSHKLAKALYDWLPDVIQPAKVWMSDEDIPKGGVWGQALGKSLAKHDIGILCVTHENYEAPWIAFEAGALSKAFDNSRVCPLLFGLSPDEITGPLAVFQATVFEPTDILKLLKDLNRRAGKALVEEPRLEKQFERLWPELKSKAEGIAKIPIRGDADTVRTVIQAFSRTSTTPARLCSITHFSSGFESSNIYEVGTSITQARFLLLGRKNRKLFDKDRRSFFKGLAERVHAGFDFRLLFLSPEAPPHVLRQAHHDEDFKDQLLANIQRAVQTLREAGLDPSAHCRTYVTQRSLHLLVVDDAVMFTPIKDDPNGVAEELTKSPFCVVNSTFGYGAELLSTFERQWQAAKSLC